MGYIKQIEINLFFMHVNVCPSAADIIICFVTGI